MNAKAAALGMTQSHFVDPSGLSSQNVSSAKDLAKLVIAASRQASIREYSTSTGLEVKVGRQMLEFRQYEFAGEKPVLGHHRAEDGFHQ